jgi:hypothetical protein
LSIQKKTHTHTLNTFPVNVMAPLSEPLVLHEMIHSIFLERYHYCLKALVNLLDHQRMNRMVIDSFLSSATTRKEHVVLIIYMNGLHVNEDS